MLRGTVDAEEDWLMVLFDGSPRVGARLLRSSEDSDSADAFEVYADPTWHPFCLCWIRDT